MKKAAIILLIVIVLGIIGFFVYTEIKVDELSYVNTDEKRYDNGKYSVKRLYSSGVDEEALAEKIESLIMLEFTEEDITAAALEAGTPEFYPAFYIHTYRPDIKKGDNSEEALEEANTVYIDITPVQQLAKGQQNTDYSMSDLKLEIMTTGVTIVEAEAVGTDSLNRQIDESVLKNEAGTGVTFELNDYGTANLKLKGLTGSVTFQFTYDIKKNSLLPAKALEGCFTKVKTDIITDAENNTDITYTLDPISSLEEYAEQEE